MIKMLNEIKKYLLFYGASYVWVKRDLVSLAHEANKMIENKKAVNAEHAAYLTIDARF